MTLIVTKNNPRKLYKVKEIPTLPEFSWMTESILRHMIYQSNPHKAKGEIIPGNGMIEAGVIKRPYGKRILIDADNLRNYLNTHNVTV